MSRSVQRLRRLTLAIPLATSLQATAAVTTATIVSSSLSPDCLEYKVVGICYWLFCTPYGCKVKTSAKVRHFVPDAVVSSYANTGENPWTEMASFSPVSSVAAGGNDPGDSPTQANTTISARFKNTDVIGHPGGYAFSQFASGSGYVCKGAGTAYMPYLLSNYDYMAWRYGIPEAVYPEALIPGKREVGGTLSGDLWGNVYPRSGFLHQPDDYKAAAVMAQRAGDVVTRSGQIHVYQSLLAQAEDGYWPAGELLEGDATTGKWQELTPTLSQSCAAFPNPGPHVQDAVGAYAWALWRPYSCCKREGQVFLGSTDFQ
ncbi:TIGR03756 family integrating conjugative element protein [Pseudomonas oryzihabitans]|uniref:TIGR03756 family integrating conjugative element protein n=1 Tax=Pseudomonas oryzihabitans TaxID=47885 RepID=UPI002895BA56|nr:TIGR03756 family integrating conjugative element protein [Pseudomonas oryzihabitans]MDT3722666.1 TIGR03756 family integrating conjugative element protein [Pseudomonas oryzihabitans]